jgi:tetratricopeptide (TPR) repeat protein
MPNGSVPHARAPEPVAYFQEALRRTPDNPDLLIDYGVALAQASRLPEAVAAFERALRLQPDLARAHHNLGIGLAQQGRPDDAQASVRRAVELSPDYVEAHYNLGNLLCERGRREEAVASYHRALRLRPDYTDALNNLANCLTELRRPGEAAVFLEQAVRLRPDFAEAWGNLGLARADLGRFHAAVAAYREALRLNPRYAEAQANLACAYHLMGRVGEAEAAFRLALWLNSDSASARWNRSLLLLQAGQFEEGWREYEWRWKRPRAPVYTGVARRFRQPQWDGSPLEGRTILLTMEQGLGDMIQFIRYAGPLKERGGRVVVECPHFLARLFATCPGVDQVVAEGGALPDFDTHVPVLSLPGLCGTRLETVPATVPYLAPDPDRAAEWRRKLETVPEFKVGIVWQGNPHHKWDRWRSVPLAAFESLARVPGVRLFSLQHGRGAEQLTGLESLLQLAEAGTPTPPAGADVPAAAPRCRFPVTALAAASNDFAETAAAAVNMDLIVTVDTATAHLAGALGVPVWVLVHRMADWRWLFGREESPWYPTMRLFRQRRLGRWGPVIRRVARELRRAAVHRTDPPVAALVPLAPASGERG